MFLLHLNIDPTNTSHFNIMFLVIMKLPFFILLGSAGHHVSTVPVKIADILAQGVIVEILLLSEPGFL